MEEAFYQSHQMDSFYEDSDIFFPPHFHEEVELFVLEEGRVKVCLDGKNLVLLQGDAMLVLPSVVHSYESDGHSRFFISLAKCAETVPSVVGRRCRNPVVRSSTLRPEFSLICSLLASEHSQFSVPSRPERFHGYLAAVYDMVVERLEFEEAEVCDSSNVIHRTVSYVIEHFREPLTLDDVAHAVGVNRYYLSKVFSKKLNVGFSAYLSSCRVSEAMKLLSSTDVEVDRIGDLCGFESPSSFFRNFKSLVGTSPLQYRKRRRSDEDLR